jgi:hypothetical protein
MDSKAQILAKSILQYFQEMNDPFFDNLQDIEKIEEMASEILKEAETMPELPDETPLHSSHLRAAGFDMIDGRFYSDKANMVIDFTEIYDAFCHKKIGKTTIFRTVGDLRKYLKENE